MENLRHLSAPARASKRPRGFGRLVGSFERRTESLLALPQYRSSAAGRHGDQETPPQLVSGEGGQLHGRHRARDRGTRSYVLSTSKNEHKNKAVR
jgi:hypothetical protein